MSDQKRSLISTAPVKLDPAEQSWLADAGALALIDALSKGGFKARFVGGCVRDALLGKPVGDLDLAVDCPPDETTLWLERAGIKVVPTGLAYGTVTAVVNRRPYEITSLRQDIETDGRHARVVYSNDWRADAARRDFTINALYADPDGTLYDFEGGLQDLADRKIRFIGDARARLREDVLRILRYFRFLAATGFEAASDDEAMIACQDSVALVPTLSAERVGREVLKMLDTPNPAPSWKKMVETKILPFVVPEATKIGRLFSLIEVEKKTTRTDAVVRLAALIETKAEAEKVAVRLKLSKKQAERLAMLVSFPSAVRGKKDGRAFRRLIYTFGAECAESGFLLAGAESGEDMSVAMQAVRTWEHPVFPLRGEPLLAEGFEAGPALGAVLRAVETWWQAEDFKPSFEACRARALAMRKN